MRRIVPGIVVTIALVVSSGRMQAAVSGYAFSSTLRSYNPLAGSTTQVLNPGDDEVLSGAQPIGFSFVYDGLQYTQFKASSNGFLTLNVNQSSSLPTNALATNALILAALWDDLSVDATGKVHYQVTGSAPNRVLTVEFLNMRWSKFAPAANASFQIKLYEGSNKIECLYGLFGTPNFAGASIGISDILANSSSPGLNANHFTSVTPGSPSTTSSATENPAVASLPDFGGGTVYTFTPPAPITAPVLTIGASGTYTSIQSAFNDLRNRGIANAVTLRVLSDYAPESPAGGIVIDHIPGTSAVNTAGLVVDPGVAKTISISNGSGIDYSVRLRGVRYLTIDGSAGSLAIQNTGTNPSSAVKLMDGVQNCVLKHLTLQAEGNTTPGTNGVVYFASQNTNNSIGIANSNNIVRGCTVTKATLRCANGVLCSGSGTAPLNDGNRVDSCTISDWGVGTGIAQAGVSLGQGYSNTIVADNELYMSANVPSYPTQAGLLIGIYASDPTASVSILRNHIHDILPNTLVAAPTIRGIRVFANATTPVSFIANNFVTLDAASTTNLGSAGTLYGISDEGSGTTSYYFNSVRIGGTQSSGAGQTAAFDRPGTGVTTLRDNILYNARKDSAAGSGKQYALRRSSSAGSFSSNYNDLYVDAAGGVVGFTASDQATLAAWKAASNQDSNSISANPSYTSALDLHLQSGSLLESEGTPIAAFSTDKDGETRNPRWPDPGADEFAGSSPSGFNLLSPVNNASTQPVNGTVRWSNASRAGGYDVYLDVSNPPNVLVSVNQFDTTYSYGSLNAGTTYYWRVKARNAAGEADPIVSPFSFTAGNVPNAPASLSITSVTASALSLDWADNAANETGYRIYRSANSGGPFVQVGSDQPANTVTFTNSGLSPNTRYFYRVVAFNSDGESNFSARDSSTLAVTPNAPALANISFTSMSVILDSTGNPPPTQFAIFENTTGSYVQTNGALGAGPAWQTYTQWGRAAGIAAAGLNRTATYTFAVNARNGNLIETAFGATASATTLTPINAFPYSIDFEGTSDSNWTTAKFPTAGVPNPANDWARGSFTKLSGPFSGTKAWVTKLSGIYSTNHNASLISPEFNFSSFTKAPTVSFNHNFKTELFQDAGIFEYTTDGGTTWTRLGVKNDPAGTNWYTNDSTGAGVPIPGPNWSGTSSGWKSVSYKPSVLIGKPVVQFRFRFGSDVLTSDSGWAVDKFQITPPVTKDIQVVSVSLTQPRMLNYPITVSAKIRNLGGEANPASVPVAYKKTTPPASFVDAGAVAQTFSPAWSGDSATVTFTTAFTPSATGTLKMYVRSFYSGDLVPANDSSFTAVTVNVQNLYFSQAFDSTTFPPSGWSALDANNDGFKWYRGTVAPFSGAGHAAYSYNSSNISTSADDWLFTAPVDLDASRAYAISFQYRVKSAAYPERLEVTIGSQATPAGQTQLLNFPALTNTQYQQASRSFAVASNGTYYIGFHCYSNPNEWDLYVDDVRLTLTNNFDLALSSLQQVSGGAPAGAAMAGSRPLLLESATTAGRLHIDEVKFDRAGLPSVRASDANNSILAYPKGNGVLLSNGSTLSLGPLSLSGLLSTINLKAAVANVGSNDVSSYALNWTVSGVTQSQYQGGFIPRFTGIDSASLNYSPTARGTFFTRAIGVLALDSNHTNDTATTRMKVYPDVAFTLKYDLGNSAAQFRVGYDRQVGASVTGGVRFTATQDMKLANVDVYYTDKNNTTDTFQSQDSVWVRVWAAGAADSAPGAQLYSRKFAGQDYITSNPSGESFSLPLGDDAPAFASGTNYWVSATFDSLIRFPMGADPLSTGRSFISADRGSTWSPLSVNVNGTPTESAWWLRCVSKPLGSISGTKFNDLNGNGIREAGEPGLAGWKINISGPSSGSAITDANGNYSFTSLDGGVYTLTEFQQGGWTQTMPVSPGSYTVNLATGGPVTGKDFGNFRLGSISGTKFNDLNGNGAKDAGEPGLSGWKIRLLRGASQADSTLTNVNGDYSFSNLAAGTYTLQEEFQSGWIQTYPPSQGNHTVTVTSGAVITLQDFGNVQTSGIAGVAYHDLNANGVRDTGETGLSNWRIRLEAGGTVVDSTVTDSGGAYTFLALAPGTYMVSEAPQSGWIQSDPASPGTHTVDLSGGGSASNENFGNYLLGSISGIAFNDTNGNGLKDGGETALIGWNIRLSGKKADSVLTDAQGRYSFTGLVPGTYLLTEVLQSGWGRSLPGSPGTYPDTLTSGRADTGRNFGNYQFSTISGMKFDDLNGNGLQDGGEPGISGWLIRLSGAQSAAQTTDTSGSYTFSNLKPGAYTISEESRSTWTQTFPASPGTQTALVTGGSSAAGKNFGNFALGSISGIKFNDLNANGTRDTNETVLSNWLIRLSQGGVQIESTLTDGKGTYTFPGLGVGTYVVSEAAQSGWSQSTPPSPGTYTVGITSGAVVAGRNFGNFQGGSVSGTAFNDLNGNGVREINDPTLSGWRIRLLQNNAQIDSAMSDSMGNYRFQGLVPGSYTIGEAVQSGWVETFPASPSTHSVVMTGGGTLSGKDFGNYRLGTISGIKFNDLNGNGVRDGGEPALAGWRIRISFNGIQTDSALTDTGGHYSFTGLLAGTYQLSELIQSGWAQSLPAAGTYTVVVTSGAAVSGKDFGNFRYSTIGGMKFNDTNGNAAKDAGEPGLANWRVRLSKNGVQVDSLLTDGSGNYTFRNVTPGTYTIAELSQSGWIETVPPSPGTYTVLITSGSVVTSQDFGNFQLGSIGGMKFNDLNGSGSKDAGESGLSGWWILLSRAGIQIDSALTDVKGAYTFQNLTAGTYAVAEQAQSGWSQSTPASPGTYTVIISSGTVATQRDFGNYRPGSVAGQVFTDVNGNGVREAGEPVIASSLLRLSRSGVQVDSLLSDATGSYAFVNLAPGNYSVSAAIPSGWSQTLPASPSGYTIPVISGTQVQGDDFGLFQLGAISGVKFRDFDGSGVKGTNPGIAKWNIRLDRNGVPSDSVLTDANGSYRFTNLTAGSYAVSEAGQPGWIETYPASPGTYTVIVSSGTVAPGQDFGNFQLGSIGGTTYNDLNGSHGRDAGEPGLSNWRILLTKNGAAFDSVLTDTGGHYSFSNLTAGSYTLAELQQSGWTQGSPSSPGTYTIAVTSGLQASGEDFGNFQLGSISGVTFNDVNGNGIKDIGEPVLSGWQIRLNGASETSMLSEADGAYTFSNLSPGSYTLSEVILNGWVLTAPPSPGTFFVAMTSGAAVTGRNFGNFRTGSISGMAFDDLNGNGIKDPGESALGGWQIVLTGGAAGPDTVTTDSSGFYSFTNLNAGSYLVGEIMHAGWLRTLPPPPGTYTVTISSGASVSGKDFGNTQSGTISGMKFNDLNGNGAKDAGEPALAGWRIRLTGVRADSVLTDAGGNYSFTNLSPGTYTVSEQSQNGWRQTAPGSPGSYTVSIAGGTESPGKDFGNFQLGSISGMNFNDLNQNGTRENGEPGLSNWRIRISKNGSQTDSTLTDSSGNYSFSNLTAGTYTVSEKVKPGWVQTSAPATHTVVITSGTVSANNTFGNFQTNPTPPLELDITVLLEGFYDNVSNTMVPDTIMLELHQTSSPFARVDSTVVPLNSSGQGAGIFNTAVNGTPYYIAVKHRNAIETWSAAGQAFTDSWLEFDFTTAAGKAYGKNMVQKGTRWCLYSGDCAKDGLVDGSDLNLVDNDAANFSYGYNPSDVNGDHWTDGLDMNIVDNNSAHFIFEITPITAANPPMIRRAGTRNVSSPVNKNR